MTSFFKSLWRNRGFRWFTCTVATLLTLVVLFHQWVNWSGARRWKAAQEMLAREGETLDFHQIAPNPVPDAQNFCAIPLLKNLALDKGQGSEDAEKNRKKLEAVRFRENSQTRPRFPESAASGTAPDLRAWADWLAKPDAGQDEARRILEALAPHEPVMAELTAGLARQDAQWTPPWRTRELPGLVYAITLPHYKCNALTQPLVMRAIAAAHAGDAVKAHESVLILLRLARASLADPFLIGTLVGTSQTQHALHATWELCRLHAGSAADFQRLEAELRRIDLRASLLLAFRGEMAGGATSVQWFKHSPQDTDILALLQNSGAPDAGGGALLRVLPGGWFDMNAASIVEMNHRYIVTPLRDHGLAETTRQGEALEGVLKAQKASYLLHLDSLFAQLAMPATAKMAARAAFAQGLTDLAVTACALERHRLAQGAYPNVLEPVKLADGAVLPVDIMTGKPLGYRKTADGRYALWSAGFDAEDDGGKRVLDEKQPEKTKFHEPNYTGDWVWDFPQ